MPPVLGLLLALQGPAVPATVPSPDVAPPPRRHPPGEVEAAMATAAPVLDGLATDAVWQRAMVIDDFAEVRPIELGTPRQRTEARVAYDARNLYVLVRAWDTAPDSIVGLLSRRDDETSSDQITVLIDSYHDRRTGHGFVVNPAGVQVDYAVNDNGNEDNAWDAVWDVATHVDSLGWTAEFRIPFSQLRFAPAPSVTFGFAIWRSYQRETASMSWPGIRLSSAGYVTQWGDLVGLRDIAPPRRSELIPYVVSSNEARLGDPAFARHQRLTVGGDLKYAVASNLTLNATINPDFGQVEADPSQLNLSAFEVFFQERRPFFIEGGGLFQMEVNCFITNDCQTGEGLFYSRRIGRAPSLAGIHEAPDAPTATRILGAAKLTGRLAGGLSVGVMDVVTERVAGAGGRTLEPATNYTVARVSQDFDGGNGNVGVLLTGVNRSLDAWSTPWLHRSAYAIGLDGRRRIGNYQVSGMLSGSRVAGSEEAIARTQRSSVHFLQRPGVDLGFDSTRTSLSGTSGEIRFAKVAGERTTFETGYGRRSAGFEVNDLGFLQQADEQKWSNWFALRFATPNRVYQQLRWNFNYWMTWNTAGLPTERAFNTNTHIQFTNRWWLRMGGTLGRLGGAWCDFNCTRGGPALRQDGYISPWIGIQGDNRRRLIAALWVNGFRGDRGRSHRVSWSPEVEARVSTRFSTSIGVNYSRNTNDAQFFGNFTDGAGTTHHTFAHLEQETLGLTWRLGYTFSPTASLQVYAQPFVSRGEYSDIREVADAGAAEYADRFQPYTDAAVADDPGGFNFTQFRSNVVFRWQYSPGSTLFLVWSQGREGFLPMRGQEDLGGDLDRLFGQRASDVFLVKMSYWLNW